MARSPRRPIKLFVEALETRQLFRGGPLDWRGLHAAALRGRFAVGAAAMLVGRVVDAHGRGVAGAPVRIGAGPDAVAVRADAHGRFVVRGPIAEAGAQPVAVDGPNALPRGRYAVAVGTTRSFADPVAAEGVDAPASLTIVLPSIDRANATDFRKVGPRRAVDVTTPAAPGFALHVAAGNAANAAGRAYRGRIAVTALPGPSGAGLIEIDGPGLAFRAPAPVTLPNAAGAAPGSEFPLLTMDASGAVATSGTLRVSADGRSLQTVAGGVAGPGLVLAPGTAAPSPPDASPQGVVANPGPTPASPGIESVAPSDLSVAVGATLDATIAPGGFAGDGVVYTITPQPLPANMSFNRGDGELIFAPAPGQAGSYKFTVAASDGVRTVVQDVVVEASQPKLESTMVSGRVVDEAGKPLASMPVSLGPEATTTDEDGFFTLANVPADPGPIRVGGAEARAQDRLALSAPVPDLLGHPLYDGSNNVFPTPLILPKVDWSDPSASGVVGADDAQDLVFADPATPGFEIRIPGGAAEQDPPSVSLSTAHLPASLSAQHLPPGMSSDMLLVRTSGLASDRPVILTMPNASGYAPGSVLNLLKFNPATGGRDAVVGMVVSEDGRTLTSVDPVTMGSSRSASGAAAARTAAAGVASLTSVTLEDCLVLGPAAPGGQPIGPCHGCEPPAGDVAPVGSFPGPSSNLPQFGGGGTLFASDVGLVTGAFFQDHQTAAYFSQGLDRGVDLQYSSAQASPKPIVQFQFTPPPASSSSSITSITATASLAGVVQGAAVTYNSPSVVNGQPYNIPMQVDGTALPTGVYPYKITVVEHFGATSITVVGEGLVNVVNAAASPLGAGWSVGGLQKVDQLVAGGPVVITAGQQGTERFNPVYNAGQTKFQDLALASGSSTSRILANDGVANFATSGAPSGVVAGTVAGDFNGDGKPDQAVSTASSLGVLLNNGAGGFTAGSSYSTASGFVAKAVAVGNFTGHVNGVLDLAVLRAPTSGSAGYSVAIYTGVGDGTFSAPVISNAGNGAASTSGPDSIVAGDFNGDGKTDLAFSTVNGLLDVMLATTGGSMGSATGLALASGHSATGVATVDYNGDGKLDLVVETSAAVTGSPLPIAFLNLYTGSGAGSFSSTSSYMTVGHPISGIIGLVAGNFRGTSAGLEVAIPVHGDAPGLQIEYIDLVPLSASGVWGDGVLHALQNAVSPSSGGNIVAADLNGTNSLSIALTDGTGYIRILSPDPDSNQFFPIQNILAGTGGSQIGMLAVAPFMGTAAVSGYRGPASNPSTLVQNVGGGWTRSYPDGTVIQFDSTGRETSEADRNGNTTAYAYVAAGQPGVGSVKTITDPVGLKTTFTYNGSGKLSTIADPAGRTTTITMDASGNLTAIKDPDNAVTTFGYSTPSNHRITTEVNPNNKTAAVTYNAFGQATSESLFGGGATSSVIPAQSRGLLAPGGSGTLSKDYRGSVTDPNNKTTTMAFTWMSHPAASVDAISTGTTFTYNRQGFPVTATDALSRKTTYTYDMRGNVTSITRPDSSVMRIAYDPAYSVPTSVTDFLGLTTTYTLDAHGNVLRRNDPDGQHEDWTYNAAGQVLTHAERGGATTAYRYDAHGRLDRVTNPSGAVTSYAQSAALGGTATASSGTAAAGFDRDPTTKWTATGASPYLQYQFPGGGAYTVTQYRLTSAADAAMFPGRAPKSWQLQGSNTGSSWTAVDARTNQADVIGSHVTTFVVTSPGSYKYYRLVVTANNGDPTTTQLADLDLQVARTSAVSVPATYVYFGYDSAGNVASTTDELGHVWYAAYDAMNRLSTTQDPVQAAAGPTVKTSYAYDPAGNLLSVTDALGHATSYAYDARNRAVSSTDAVNQGTTKRTTYTYDGMNMTAVTDPLGHTTSYAYDARNRLASVTDALGHAWSTYYNNVDQVILRTAPGARDEKYLYDVLGRVVNVQQPVASGPGYFLTDVAVFTYDANGNLRTSKDALNRITTYAYDELNRRVGSLDPMSHATAWSYDPEGRATLAVDPMGFATTSVYDVRGRLIGTTDPSGGGTTTYAYDLASRLTSLTDPAGNVTSWSYDDAGRVLTETDPRSKVATYAYDLVGNATQKTDRLGRATQYAYDADDRIKTEKWIPAGGGAAVNTITYTYDDAGRTTQVQDAASKYAYTYDAADRLLTVDDAGTTGLPQVTLTYGYDDAGTRSSLADSKGGRTTYTYDRRNQLAAVTQSGTGVAAKRVDFGYDAAGQLTALTRYSNTAGTTTVLATTYAYNGDGLVAGISHKTSGGTTRVSFAYLYDADDRVTQDTRVWNTGGSSDVVGYGYTNDGQLTSVTHSNGSYAAESFSYDANGNRNMSGYSTGTGNRTSTDGVYNYTYDDEGNQTARTKISDGSQTLYKWDHRNRLVEVDSKVGAVTTVLATYTYDALDRRIGRKAGATTTWTLYDDSSPILDFNAAGTQTARHLQAGPDVVDEVLARETSAGVAWYLPDRLGTIRDLVDNSGAIIDHVDYNAYGQASGETFPAVGDRMMGFAGLVRDITVGLNLAVHRVQDPATGKWLSEDPIGFTAGDANLYRYVGNEATNAIDPMGTTDWSNWGGQITIAPGFNPGDRRITYIPEDYERELPRPAQRPLPLDDDKKTYFVDSVLIEGIGMYKIKNGCFAVLINDRETGKPVVKPIYFYPPVARFPGGYSTTTDSMIPVFPSWGVTLYPINKRNPMGPYGDVPGGQDETKLPPTSCPRYDERGIGEGRKYY